MAIGHRFLRVLQQEDVTFLLTNRIPRHALTRFMGWFARVEFPPVRAASIATWKFFSGADLGEAEPQHYQSLREAFIRPLREGARPVDADPAVIASPCDGIVGAFGRIDQGTALQVKGMPYPVADLFGLAEEAAAFEGGWFITLRLTAGMYHRFHAPHDLTVQQLRYISGDTWNVNPIALKRIERLFCRNERAPITVRLDASGKQLVLVPVAAVLVASIRLPWYDEDHDVRRKGERVEPVSATFAKGDEMGWFEHGSTIVVFSPADCPPVVGLETGQAVKMGEKLMRIDE